MCKELIAVSQTFLSSSFSSFDYTAFCYTTADDMVLHVLKQQNVLIRRHCPPFSVIRFQTELSKVLRPTRHKRTISETFFSANLLAQYTGALPAMKSEAIAIFAP